MSSRYGRQALRSASSNIENASRGNRHKTLFAEAVSLGELVNGGEITDSAEIYQNLVAAGRNTGIPESDVQRQVKRGIEKAKNTGVARTAPADFYAPRDKGTILEDITKWWEYLTTCHKLSANQLKIARTIALRAADAQTLYVAGSYRQVALESGLAFKTIARNANRIPNLTHIPGDRRTSAPSMWKISLDGVDTAYRLPTGYVIPLCSNEDQDGVTLLDQSHNAWAGTRSTAWTIYCVLRSEGEKTEVELSEAIGKHKLAVRHQLKYLMELSLVEKTFDDTYQITGETAVDEAKHGIKDVKAKRTMQYTQDQSSYKIYYLAQRIKRIKELAHVRLEDWVRLTFTGERFHLVDITTGETIRNVGEWVNGFIDRLRVKPAII